VAVVDLGWGFKVGRHFVTYDLRCTCGRAPCRHVAAVVEWLRARRLLVYLYHLPQNTVKADAVVVAPGIAVSTRPEVEALVAEGGALQVAKLRGRPAALKHVLEIRRVRQTHQQ